VTIERQAVAGEQIDDLDLVVGSRRRHDVTLAPPAPS
jgi:hypothetical protein